ncbi:hypothetical protein [Streptomyces sp. KR80]|uniref:hypothetical protein n=1 Tax=Streptomyces sp. KR80 TaxID=3457426 RepID=UPI003FD018EA
MAERDTGPGREDGRDPVDEDAAWAAIVAAYGAEPADPELSMNGDGTGEGDRKQGAEEDGPEAGTRSERADEPGDSGDSADSGDESEAGPDDPGEPTTGTGEGGGPAGPPLGSSVMVFSAGIGPRDWSGPEPAEDDFDEDDEGHFVPPEPPPLPEADTTAKFAWLAVVGGPLLLLLTVVLQWDMTWWIATLGIGGFLGGFATLVLRMKDSDDDEYDDPGRGAVV